MHHTRAMKQRSVSLAPMVLLAAFVLTAPGCDEEVLPPPDDTAVTETSGALSSAADVVEVSDKFSVSETLGIMPVAVARAQAVQAALTALALAVPEAGCMTVDTDDLTYVAATFEHCPIGLFRLREIHGALRAELDFETQACGLGGQSECPVAAIYTMQADNLRISHRLLPRFVELDGSWTLRDEVAAGLPTTISVELAVDSHRGRSLSMSASASWTITGQCATIDFDAELEVRGLSEEDEELGVIAASGRAIERCASECPARGSVQIAYGKGEILAWSFTGSDTIVAQGPRGRSIEVDLDCASE